jgi:Zn-dependent M28 family amino/carboxypeptidase
MHSTFRAALLGLGGAALLVGAAGVLLRQPNAGSPQHLGAARADPARLERAVRQLTSSYRPRDADHPENLEAAAAWIEEQLRASGARVDSQTYSARGAVVRNVVARLGPTVGPRIVVGAHYDAFALFGDFPGADDNASGTAGVIELAHLLAGERLAQPVELVAYTLEEPPWFGSATMGSRVHAASLAERGIEVEMMVGLEMIGYFADEQRWPSVLLAMLYPRRGDFVAVVGRPRDGGLARRVKRWMRAGGVPVYSFNGPVAMGTDGSDHASYWHYGMPAVMVTDTAFMRNPHYHTARDTADTLDYRRMAQVVDGVAGAVLRAAAER